MRIATNKCNNMKKKLFFFFLTFSLNNLAFGWEDLVTNPSELLILIKKIASNGDLDNGSIELMNVITNKLDSLKYPGVKVYYNKNINIPMTCAFINNGVSYLDLCKSPSSEIFRKGKSIEMVFGKESNYEILCVTKNDVLSIFGHSYVNRKEPVGEIMYSNENERLSDYEKYKTSDIGEIFYLFDSGAKVKFSFFYRGCAFGTGIYKIS